MSQRNATVDFNGTLKRLALVEGALRNTSPGGLSQELIARASELVKARAVATIFAFGPLRGAVGACRRRPRQW